MCIGCQVCQVDACVCQLSACVSIVCQMSLKCVLSAFQVGVKCVKCVLSLCKGCQVRVKCL